MTATFKTKVVRMMVKELKVDTHYGRLVNPGQVDRIAKKFNPNAVGIFIAAQRRNGEVILLDGNHRLHALRKLGKDAEVVDVLLFIGTDMAEEARLFALLNSHLPVHAVDVFRSNLVASEPEAVAINKTMLSHGFQATRDTDKGGGISGMLSVYQLHRADILDRSLGVLAAAYPKMTKPVPGVALRSVGELLLRNPKVDDKRLSKILGEKDLSRWSSEAKHQSQLAGGGVTKVLYNLIGQAYNKHLGPRSGARVRLVGLGSSYLALRHAGGGARRSRSATGLDAANKAKAARKAG